MLKGTIENLDFNYTIEDVVLDDWNLLKLLRKIDDGETVYIVDAMELLLGAKQEEKLEKAIKEKCGHVSTTEMMAAFSEIMKQSNETKK